MSSPFILRRFSHAVVFPITWRFFVGFTSDIVTFMPRIEPAFSIYLRLILALGITFQLPTLVLFLARMGMITPRFMIRNFSMPCCSSSSQQPCCLPTAEAWDSSRWADPSSSLRSASGLPGVRQEEENRGERRDTVQVFSSRCRSPSIRLGEPGVYSCRLPAFQALCRWLAAVERDIANGGLRLGLDRRSHAAEPHHGETTKPGRPSMMALNSS